MPLTKLEEKFALIVIDLQKGIAGLPAVHPAKDIIRRTAQLAGAFRERNRPVILVNVTGMAPGRSDAGRPNIALPAGWTELVDELQQHPGDYLVTRQRWGAFLGTGLDAYLRAQGVTQVFITGIATSAGVESTARSAYDLGYHVVLVLDAMTDRDAGAHRNSVERIFPRLGETTETAEVLKFLGEPETA